MIQTSQLRDEMLAEFRSRFPELQKQARRTVAKGAFISIGCLGAFIALCTGIVTLVVLGCLRLFGVI